MQIYLNKSHSSTCRFIFMLKRLNFECKSVSESQNVVACCVDVCWIYSQFFFVSPPFRLCFVLFRSQNSQTKNRWSCENNMATHDFRWSLRQNGLLLRINRKANAINLFKTFRFDFVFVSLRFVIIYFMSQASPAEQTSRQETWEKSQNSVSRCMCLRFPFEFV